MVLAMIRALPRHSRYATLAIWRRDKGLVPETDEADKPQWLLDVEEREEMRMWAQLHNEVGAMGVNRIQDLADIVMMAAGNKAIGYPTVGPAKWREARDGESKPEGSDSSGGADSGGGKTQKAMKAMGLI